MDAIICKQNILPQDVKNQHLETQKHPLSQI